MLAAAQMIGEGGNKDAARALLNKQFSSLLSVVRGENFNTFPDEFRTGIIESLNAVGKQLNLPELPTDVKERLSEKDRNLYLFRNRQLQQGRDRINLQANEFKWRQSESQRRQREAAAKMPFERRKQLEQAQKELGAANTELKDARKALAETSGGKAREAAELRVQQAEGQKRRAMMIFDALTKPYLEPGQMTMQEMEDDAAASTEFNVPGFLSDPAGQMLRPSKLESIQKGSALPKPGNGPPVLPDVGSGPAPGSAKVYQTKQGPVTRADIIAGLKKRDTAEGRALRPDRFYEARATSLGFGQ